MNHKAVGGPAPGTPLTAAEARGLARRVEDGDKTALPGFRDFLRNDPVGRDLVVKSGCTKRDAENAAVEASGGDSRCVAECVRVRLESLRRELGWDEAGALEKIV